MSSPDTLKFLDSHEWIQPDAESAAVGISDHAQSELSDVVYVELPEVGREVSAGDAVAVVESVKAASDIYAPVAGEIVEVNEALGDEPGAINSDPYGNGWLFKIRPANPSAFEDLLGYEAYQQTIG